MPATSAQIRDELLEALRLDLVGPDNDHAFAHELLPDSPRRWYLTGFLVPRGAPEEQRTDAQANEEVDAGGDIDGDDTAPPDRAAAKKSYLPSSLGLSVLVAPGIESLVARVTMSGKKPKGPRRRPRQPISPREPRTANPVLVAAIDAIPGRPPFPSHYPPPARRPFLSRFPIAVA